MGAIKLLWSGVTSTLGGIYGYLAVGALAAVLATTATYKIMHNANLASQTKAAEQTVRLVEHQAAINVSIGDVVVRGVTVAETDTTRREQEIPTHVTPQIDAAYPVPLGFVRVFNDASHGPVPDSSYGIDAAPSGVPLSDVATAHVADEGTLDVCRVRLTGWQDWYTQQKALVEKAR